MKIDDRILERISEATFRKTAEIGLRNAEANKQYIEKTIRDLKRELVDRDRRPALVISAGPSLHRKAHIRTLKETGFDGYIVAADGAMGHCLRNGVVPDFVLTVDPHLHRIIRWFGDPRMNERPEDDYFRRQDLDPEINSDEEQKNNETIALVDKYGPDIKLIISTSVTPEIAQRALEADMTLYWWNPLFDDFENAESYSRRLFKENNAPCMTTGGNVGSSCWVFAQAILQADRVLMVGMDFSYPPGTNVYNTQYYEVLKDLYPDEPEKGLFEIYNPHLRETWLTDPGYYWYFQNFLQMIKAAKGKTINCTEGGILFGDSIVWMPFDEALTGGKEK